MKVCTLLFLLKDDQILLAMKKRGFGEGRWNGVGGKVEAGETIEQAVVRECQEEIRVTPLNPQKVAIHDFKQTDDMIVHTFVCRSWQGEPSETQEMRPQWFSLSDIPYAQMWPDDQHWLPRILAGQKIESTFIYDSSDNIVDYAIKEVNSL